jgi:AraC-like DNA-binding protein
MYSLPQPYRVEREMQDNSSYQRNGRNCQIKNHFTLTYTIAGRGVFRNSAGEHVMKRGSIFLRADNAPEMSFFYPEDGKEAWDFLWFNFRGESVAEMVNEITDRYGAVFNWDEGNPVLKELFSFERYDKLTLSLSPENGAKLVWDSLRGLILSKTSAQTNVHNLLIEKANKYVTANICKNYFVGDLASDMNLSREHLTRVFSENLHMTPYNYIIKQKMLFACDLLNHTSLSIKQISAKLGYMRQSQLNKVFKRTFKMSPTEFRKSGLPPII